MDDGNIVGFRYAGSGDPVHETADTDMVVLQPNTGSFLELSMPAANLHKCERKGRRPTLRLVSDGVCKSSEAVKARFSRFLDKYRFTAPGEPDIPIATVFEAVAEAGH